MARRRQSSKYSQPKAKPMEAIYGAAVSTVMAVIYFVVIMISVSMAGDTPNWVGGVAMLAMLIDIVSFVAIIRQIKTNTDFTIRIICLSVGAISLLLWLVTFIAGALS